eukprot:SAG31_NODE_933_length_10897_cov_15.489442_4_plen_82_part_00
MRTRPSFPSSFLSTATVIDAGAGIGKLKRRAGRQSGRLRAAVQSIEVSQTQRGASGGGSGVPRPLRLHINRYTDTVRTAVD